MSEQQFIARQPILDRDQNLVAYELLFRDGNTETATVTDDLRATAHVITNVFGEMGVQAVLGKNLGFINVSREMLLADMIELLPANQIVLEILETVAIDQRIIERCIALKKLGFTIALDDFALMRDEYRALLPLIDVVKVDLMLLDENGLIAAARNLRTYPARLLAEKIDSQQQFELCLQLGFHYFQGYFFAKPALLSSRRADPSQLTLLRLLGLVLEDAATADLETAFKQDPKLTYTLLRLVNSVACGVNRHIHSMSQAIMVLGRRQLQRWLQLLMFALEQRTSHAPSPLMQLAATRGKLMETLCARINDKDGSQHEQAFMAGIFSLLDALLGMPIADIVEQLRLPETLRAALLERTGTLGRMLNLCEKLETGDFAGVEAILGELPGVTAKDLTEAQFAAARWVAGLEQTSN
jgi:EAL and modified HD-GYP domain-containing signal transduction protein